MIHKVTSSELTDVIEAVDEILQDNEALYDMAQRLGTASDDPEDAKIAHEDYLRLRTKELDPRMRYTLGSIAGGQFALQDVATSMRAYSAHSREEADNTDEVRRLGRLGRVYRLIVDTLHDPTLVDYKPIDYSYAELPHPSAAPRTRRPSFTYAKYTPDKDDPTKHWLSLSDRRTIIVGGGSGVGSVLTFPVLATQPHESGEGVDVLWAKSEGEQWIISGDLQGFYSRLGKTMIAGLEVQTYTVKVEGTEYVRYVANASKVADDRMSVQLFNSRHMLQLTHVTHDSDTYWLNGNRLELIVPAGRIALSSLIDAEMIEGVFAEVGADSREVSSTLDAVLEATGQKQRPIIDTFRPINTGRPGVPQVNPRLLPTGKQN